MSNSKNSASPTAQKGLQEAKQETSSYWLTPEEIAELHEDAKRSEEEGWELMKKRYGENLMLTK